MSPPIPKAVDSADQTMPCPRCRRPHRRGEYGHRPEHAKKPLGNLLRGRDGLPYPPGHRCHGVRSGTPFGPADVACPCGARLRHVVPIFCTDPHGWHWEIM